jgi:glycine cleavage system aminomethyltransferase T
MPVFRHTPLFHAHKRAGATMVEHYGWQVPASFTGAQQEANLLSNSAAVSDLSWTTKLDVKGCGVEPAGAAWHLSPGHFLMTCDPPKREALIASLPPAYVTDVTSVYAQFLIAGPRSRDILRKLTSLNVAALRNLECGQAAVAHTHTIVLRNDFAKLPGFHILVSREYAESVWEAILHSGHEFHAGPCGFKPLEQLGAAL